MAVRHVSERLRGFCDRQMDRRTDGQTDRQTDNCDSRVAFATEMEVEKLRHPNTDPKNIAPVAHSSYI